MPPGYILGHKIKVIHRCDVEKSVGPFMLGFMVDGKIEWVFDAKYCPHCSLKLAIAGAVSLDIMDSS